MAREAEIETRRSEGLLRVLHVAPQLSTGGLERLLVEFARHTDRQSCDLRFLALGRRGRPADEIEACGWPVTTLGYTGGLRPAVVMRLAQCFRRWRVDVVHTHNNPALVYAAPAARLAGVRTVVHTRHGQSFGISPRAQKVFKWAASLCSRVVCVSEDSRKLTLKAGLPDHKVVRLWNGIDLQRFAYSGPRKTGPVLTVARISPVKDIATLLHATARALPHYPDFRLVVAGDGECLPEVRRLAQELRISGSVEFLGEVADVAGLLGQAALFVLPSLSEGVSLTLLEAMARGLPVVATRVGGTPEVVVEGETGFLVPSRNPEALAAAMLRVLTAPCLGPALGRAGRTRVEQHFDSRKMVRDYEELYRAERRSAGAAASTD